MQDFFNTLQKGDQQSAQRLDEVLKGGKGDIKRASAVDKSLYGTEAGVQAKKQYEQQQAVAQQKKKQKKLAAAKQAEQKERRKETAVKVATVGTVVGIAAAAAAFLIGGSRSR
jgi:biotin carboxyl carrier protein